MEFCNIIIIKQIIKLQLNSLRPQHKFISLRSKKIIQFHFYYTIIHLYIRLIAIQAHMIRKHNIFLHFLIMYSVDQDLY